MDLERRARLQKQCEAMESLLHVLTAAGDAIRDEYYRLTESEPLIVNQYRVYSTLSHIQAARNEVQQDYNALRRTFDYVSLREKAEGAAEVLASGLVTKEEARALIPGCEPLKPEAEDADFMDPIHDAD